MQTEITYEVSKSKKNIDGKIYTIYGVIMHSNSENTCIEDVSLSEETVQNIVRKLNKFKVSPIHFEDVIQDFIEN